MNWCRHVTLACLSLQMLLGRGFLDSGQNAIGGTMGAKPNLIVIMTDEHNFRTLGCYRETMEKRQAYMWGPAVVETPNLDWIARQGAMCTSFYATTPVCSPSRGCLVSGLYPQHHAVFTNNIPLADDVITFAELLRRDGYATGFAGKWHLDGAGKPQWSPKSKFGFDDNRFMFNRGHWKKLELTPSGPRVATRKNGRPSYTVQNADHKTFTTDFLVDRTIEFIEEHSGSPFCYMVSIPDPHGPDSVRAPYDTMYNDQVYEKPTTFDVDADGLPTWGQPQPKAGYNQSKYYGMVKCIDDNVGRIIAKLRSEGILDNTMIVFTSDHGDLRGEHHRHNKGVPYEGSTRVPFLVYYPAKIKPATVVNEAMTSVDFLPTLLALFDHSTQLEFDGRDVSTVLINGSAPQDWDDVAFVRGTGNDNGWLMAVSDRYKLIVSASDPPCLFDLERDPDEVVNLFSHPGYRETVRRLAHQLQVYGKQFDDPFIKSAGVVKPLDWAIRGNGDYEHVW
jgi:arylsulfatase A-like enzyme